MPKLVILYGQPDDSDAFEDYYANRHIPYASTHMPGVHEAENLKVVGTAEGAPSPYYRISQLSYDSLAELQAGIATDDGQATLADLENFATGGATVLVTAE